MFFLQEDFKTEKQQMADKTDEFWENLLFQSKKAVLSLPCFATTHPLNKQTNKWIKPLKHLYFTT